MAIVGYARVSTPDQNLDVQIGQLQQAGCDKIFHEKISGSRSDRQELAALLNYVREGDCVVCTKMDRIARSTKHLLDIVDGLSAQKVSFQVLNINLDTSTPTGRLMLTMLGAVAEFERSLMLERQREGIQRAKGAGKYRGRAPKAREKKVEILEFIRQGRKKKDIANDLGIGLSSVYRILSEENNGPNDGL